MQEHESGLYFDFNKAFLEQLEILNSSIRVRLRDFAVLGGYADIDRYTLYPECTMVYENVTYSKRVISEYKDRNRQSFKKPYQIIDTDFPSTHQTSYLHFLDVVSDKMNAYTSWEIIASTVRIELPNQVV